MWRSGIRKPPGLLRCNASLCGVSNKEDQMKTRKTIGDFAATLSFIAASHQGYAILATCDLSRGPTPTR